LKEQATNLIVEGNARQQDKDYEGALACYSSALQLSQEPDMTSAIYFNCSIANSYMERFEDALKDAEECIRVNPAWPRGFECKGTALEVRFFPRGNL
jgi:stress-induced-phosphoprotein 1